MNGELHVLLETDREFSKMSAEKGAAEAFGHYMTADAVMLPNNGNPVVGIAAIYKSFSQNTKEILTWDPQDGKISLSEDMGYTWGIYTLTMENSKEITGKYLNVWLKQQDGSWKVDVDMGNANSSHP